MQNCVELSKKEFGNYVVQHILEKGSENDRSLLISCFFGKVYELSKNKIASNVIEKCLRIGNPSEVEDLCSEVFNQRYLKDMATDKFSNFVVQRALEVTKGPNQEIYLQRVQDIALEIKTFQFGRYVLKTSEKIKKSITK